MIKYTMSEKNEEKSIVRFKRLFLENDSFSAVMWRNQRAERCTKSWATKLSRRSSSLMAVQTCKSTFSSNHLRSLNCDQPPSLPHFQEVPDQKSLKLSINFHHFETAFSSDEVGGCVLTFQAPLSRLACLFSKSWTLKVIFRVRFFSPSRSLPRLPLRRCNWLVNTEYCFIFTTSLGAEHPNPLHKNLFLARMSSTHRHRRREIRLFALFVSGTLCVTLFSRTLSSD